MRAREGRAVDVPVASLARDQRPGPERCSAGRLQRQAGCRGGSPRPMTDR